MNVRRRDTLILAVGALTVSSSIAEDAAWPNKPLRIVAGGAGSVTDIRTRWLAPRLSAALGQRVVVENNAAAGGNVATAEVARSAPDGYTLVAWHQGIAAIGPHLYTKLGFDPLADLAPITRFGHGPLMLSVHPSFPAQSVGDLIALAKAKPGTLNFGSPGNGTPPRIASELFKRAAAIDAVHVPYRGGGALMAAMLGGQLSWSMDGPTVQAPHVRSGALRALAVTGVQRLTMLPDVPTCRRWPRPDWRTTSTRAGPATPHRPRHRRRSSRGSAPRLPRSLRPAKRASGLPCSAASRVRRRHRPLRN